MEKLGAMQLSDNVLEQTKLGLWAFELDEGLPPRMYANENMLKLIGLDHQISPEDTYHAWYDHIHKDHYDEVSDAVEQMINGVHAEVQYPWIYPDGREIIVRCGGVRNFSYTKGIRIEGTHQDVTKIEHFQLEQKMKRELDERLNTIKGLSNEFDVFHYVDLETGKYITYSANGDVIHYDNTPFSNMDFFEANKNIFTEYLHPDDKDKLIKLSNKETIKELLKNRRKVTYRFRFLMNGEYRWHEFSLIKCNSIEEAPETIICGYLDINETVENEILKANELEIAVKNAKRYLDALFNSSCAYFEVNVTKNIFVTPIYEIIDGKATDVSSSDISKFPIYNDFINEISNKVVIDHKKEFNEFFSRENIIKSFKNNISTPEFSCWIKCAQGFDRYSRHILFLSQDGKNEDIIASCIIKDETKEYEQSEIKKAQDKAINDLIEISGNNENNNQVNEILKSLTHYYDGNKSYIVEKKNNTLANTYCFNKSTNNYDLLQFVIPFNQKITDLVCENGYISTDKIEDIFNKKEYNALLCEGIESLIIYPVKDDLEIKGYICIENPKKHLNEINVISAASTLCYGEILRKKELDNTIQRAEQTSIISSMADDYSFIGLIDVSEDLTSIIYASPLASVLFNENVESESGFSGMRKKLVNFVHPDDVEEFLTKTSKDEVLANIKKYNTYILTTRLIIDNKETYFKIKFSLVNKDMNKLVVGLSNIDAQVRHEQERGMIEGYTKAQTFADTFLSSFILAYYVNLNDCSYITFHKDEYTFDDFGENPNYFEFIKEYVDSDIHEDDRKIILDAVTPENIKKRLTKEKGYFVYARDISRGEIRWYRCDISRGIDNNHAGLAFTDVTDSISETKEKEQSLSIVNQLSDKYEYICYIDQLTNDIINYHVSKEFEKLFKKYKANLHYKTFDNVMNNIILPEDYTYFRDETDKYNMIATLRTERRYSITIRAKINSSISYLEFRFAYDDEHTDGVVLGIRDVTDEVNKKKELKEAKELADAANKAKTAFLFNMSHDIRTPMNAIIGFTAMAKKYVDEKEKAIEYLEKIDISGQQLLALINQVLEMSRIEAGKIEFTKDYVNMAEEFNALATITEAQAKSKGLDFIAKIENVTHNFVYADKTRINQITLNLISNAIKYTKSGGTVKYTVEELSSDSKNATYKFIISDNGIGMSDEFIDKVYDSFARENNSTVSHIQGTGLGMSIVKNLVDLLGGTISIDTKKDVGTKIEVILSLEIANENCTKDDIDSFDEAKLKGKRILLVEDNAMNREIAKDLLSDYQMEVDEVNDGSIAVDLISKLVDENKADYYDAILMDVQMPIMNGYDATNAIRVITSSTKIHIPIIAMTANAFEEDKKKSIEAGMDAHLAKPIEIEKLLSILSKLIK